MDGWIDEIDAEGFIKGWAFEKPGHASVLTMKHAGRTLSTISADLYRPDLAVEGIGSGHHAFCVPLPPVEGAFDPLLLEICFANGQPLNVGYSFDVWRNIDLLESSYTQYVNFELTTRCN